MLFASISTNVCTYLLWNEQLTSLDVTMAILIIHLRLDLYYATLYSYIILVACYHMPYYDMHFNIDQDQMNCEL